MAATLHITGFHDAVDYKVVQCTNIEDATVVTSATGSSGTLYSVIIDSTNSSVAVSLHILDGKDGSNTEIAIKGTASSVKTCQIPTGFAFDMLNFWGSANSGEDDTTDFAGTVDLSLLCT